MGKLFLLFMIKIYTLPYNFKSSLWSSGQDSRLLSGRPGFNFRSKHLVFFMIFLKFPNFKGKLPPLGEVGQQRDLVHDKVGVSEVLQDLVPSTSSCKFSMKRVSENHLFTMLKWSKFDQGFESQTFQLNFDPLKHFKTSKTLRGIYKHLKLSTETKKPNFGSEFPRGG